MEKAMVKEHYGQESYCFENGETAVLVTRSGGRMTAEFDLGGRRIDPFYLAPWWNEGVSGSDASMRGSWFAFPLGLNEPYNGIRYPVHGFPVESTYGEMGVVREDGCTVMTLETELREDHATLTKNYLLRDGEHCVYVSDRVSGAEGRYPVGYHPTLKIPTEIGSSYLDTSAPLATYTSPVHIEDYTKGGYSCLLPDYQIEDMTRVPTVYGREVDLTRQPFVKGFDDIYMHISDPEKAFCFTALSIPSEGYLYFQLKNPRVLTGQMVWTSYTGRYYEPWNGRVNGCIGLEELTGYFYYGITAAYGENPLTARGYRMYDEFSEDSREYRIIHGVVPIGKDFQGVRDIVRQDEAHVRILGRNGEEITVACHVDFLEQPCRQR